MLDSLLWGLGGMLVTAIVGGAVWWLSPSQRVKRALRALRPMPLRDVREGLVKVRGRVVPLEALTAPFSGRPCAYFEAIIEEKYGKESWRTLVREVQQRDFLIEDDTGRARVEMAAVRAAVTREPHWRTASVDDPGPVLDELLARHGHVRKESVSPRPLRYREGALEAGEEVAVLGWADREIDPDPAAAAAGYRDAPLRVVLRSHGPHGLQVSDDPSTLS